MQSEAGDFRPLAVALLRVGIVNARTRPLIGILALQGAFAAHKSVIDSLGADTRLVRSADDLVGLDGLVLPGGESTTMSNLLLASALFIPLMKLLADGLPVFGTCAGMILLSEQILDGREDQVSFGVIGMRVRRNAYGRQIDSFETEIFVEELNRSIPAVFIRAPAIAEIDDGVEVLARLDGKPCLVRQGNAIAASFHPELTGDPSVHQVFLHIVRSRLDRSKQNARTAVVAANTFT